VDIATLRRTYRRGQTSLTEQVERFWYSVRSRTGRWCGLHWSALTGCASRHGNWRSDDARIHRFWRPTPVRYPVCGEGQHRCGRHVHYKQDAVWRCPQRLAARLHCEWLQLGFIGWPGATILLLTAFSPDVILVSIASWPGNLVRGTKRRRQEVQPCPGLR
jgi:hypothetical protein